MAYFEGVSYRHHSTSPDCPFKDEPKRSLWLKGFEDAGHNAIKTYDQVNALESELTKVVDI